MKRWFQILCTALAIEGAAFLARADETAEVSAGRELFEKDCAVCHGPLGHGDGPVADALKSPFQTKVASLVAYLRSIQASAQPVGGER